MKVEILETVSEKEDSNSEKPTFASTNADAVWLKDDAEVFREVAEDWSKFAEPLKLKPGRLSPLNEFDSKRIESDAWFIPVERGEIEDSRLVRVELVLFIWIDREDAEFSTPRIIPRAESKFEEIEDWVLESASFTIKHTSKMQKIPQNERNAEKTEATFFQFEKRKSKESELSFSLEIGSEGESDLLEIIKITHGQIIN